MERDKDNSPVKEGKGKKWYETERRSRQREGAARDEGGRRKKEKER